jgi:hypothetical protein
MNENRAQSAANFVGLVAYLLVVGGDWIPATLLSGVTRYEQKTVLRPKTTRRQRSAQRAPSRRKVATA